MAKSPEDETPAEAEALASAGEAEPAATPAEPAPVEPAPEVNPAPEEKAEPAPEEKAEPAPEEKAEPAPDAQAEPEAEEPYRERWFFDNPSIGRAIRYTFAEKRLARAVFVNALLLVVVLAVIQEAFGRAQLGLFHENISYGRLAFLGLVTIEAVVISLLAPLGFVNLFEAERREECFDQVVASGVSPHRIVFGRFFSTLAFLTVVLFSSLPFFATAIVLDGASLSQVLHAYGVLFAYSIALTSIAAAVAVGFDDTALPALIAVVAVLVVLAAGFMRRGPPVFAAWSPIRHVVLDLNDIAQGLRIGAFTGPEPYGLSLPCSALSMAYYMVLTFLGLTYAYVGPDLELTSGLDSFDSVATSRKTESTRARRGVARALLRTVQMRFFYENLSPRAQSWSPLLRAVATIVIFAGAHVIFLGAFWPSEAPKGFEKIALRTAFPYVGFCLGTLGLLALAGGGARSALLSRRPVLSLGRAKLGRFLTLFLIIGFALAVPPLLWNTAASLSGFPEAMSSPKLTHLYLLVAVYTLYIFSIALLLAMATSNPLSATGWTMILLFASNVIPSMWIPLFTGNIAGEGTSFLLDMSPIVAAYALARPGDTFPFTKFENDELVRYLHEPSWVPFAWFHVVIGVGCLAAGLFLAYRELRAHRDPIGEGMAASGE